MASAVGLLAEGALWLGAVALTGTVLAAAAWTLCRCWPNAPLAVQVWAWRVVFAGAVLGPTAHGVLVPAVDPVSAMPRVEPADTEGPTEAVGTAVEVPPALSRALLSPDIEPLPPVASADAEVPPLAWAGGVGLVVASLGLLRWRCQRRRLWRLMASGIAAPVPLTRAVAELAIDAGLRRFPTVRVVTALSTPVACGIHRGLVAVPPALEREKPAVVRAMLAHEVAHLRHRDPAWAVATQMVRGALWWNPAFHFAGRALEAAVERRADETAGEWAGRRSVARGLVRAAEWLSDPVPGGSTPLGALGMASGSALGPRVDALLGPRRAGGVGPRCLRAPLFAMAAVASVTGATVAVPGPAWASAPLVAAGSHPVAEHDGLFADPVVHPNVGVPVADDALARLDALVAQRTELLAAVERLDAALAVDRTVSAREDRALLHVVRDRLRHLGQQEAVVRELLRSVHSIPTPGPAPDNFTRKNQ